MSGLSGLVLGLSKARLGYSQGVEEKNRARAEAERQAQELAMKKALLDFQMKPKPTTPKWEMKESEDGYVWVNPETREVAPAMQNGVPVKPPVKPEKQTGPVPGTPEWFSMKEKEAQINHKYDRPTPAPGAGEIAAYQYKLNHPDPNAGADKPPSESERRAGGLLQQMYRSAEVVKNYKPKINQMAAKIPVVGNYILQHDPETQAAIQAGAQLYRSYLYTVSGATVNPDEAEQAARTYLPQPGDSEQLIAQKKASIDDMIHTVEAMAGRAKPTMGATPDLKPNDRAASLKAKYGIK